MSKAKNALYKIADLTEKKCATCKGAGRYRCCDKVFCGIIRQELNKIGVVYSWDESKEVPYMGNDGCIVKPEHRSFCVGYVCGEHLRDRKFKREYFRLCEKAGIPPQTREGIGFK